MAPKASTATATTTKQSDIPQEVPMFLRKTYHMIDSCDPLVACWSEDGETFVVKNPSKFESEIIPQFFKHSKFTSFVRQLNFYSFRKIKYVDTIRLDPKLEAETANFWRFRHEKFQRGKPHLLTEIKRMTASQNRAAADKAFTAKANAVGSSNIPVTNDNSQMKQEIDTLKACLEEMNKNMSELTSMVQKVSLKEEEEDTSPGNKRKKVEFMPMPEPVMSTHTHTHTDTHEALPEATLEMLLGEDKQAASLFPSDPMEMDAMDAALGMQPLPSPQTSMRVTSNTSTMTDTDFVDQLFDVFGADAEQADVMPEPAQVSSFHRGQPPLKPDNHPDAELMDRLSEALAVLPKDMQHQIVNRLIASITSNLVATTTSTTKDIVVVPPKMDDAVPQTPDFGMPLAAVTLASLLSYYSNLVKENQADTPNQPTVVKTIPVIPCHA